MARIPRRSPRAADSATHDDAQDVAVGDPVALCIIIERFAKRALINAERLLGITPPAERPGDRLLIEAYLTSALGVCARLRAELTGKETQ